MIEDNGKSTGGRPGLRFRYAPDFVHYLLIRLKVEHIAEDPEMRVVETILTDALGNVLSSCEKYFETLSPQQLVQCCAGIVRTDCRVGALSFSYPGVVLHGKTSCWSDIDELNGYDLQTMLKDACGDISVSIENDLNLCACGYSLLHQSGSAGVAYIGFPQKNLPGCGLLTEGKLLRGMRGFAGEVIYLQNLSRPELRKKLAVTSTRDEILMLYLRAITGLLDPAVIVIADGEFTPKRIEELRQKCTRMIDPDFLPELQFLQDYTPDNFAGMLDFARHFFYKEND